MRRFPIPRPTTVRRNNTRGVRRALRDIERAITTHLATQWAKGVQKWQKTAAYLPKPTVEYSVSACFAVRYIGTCQTTSWEG